MPYQPFFVDQVEAGNVEEISSTEQTIEGDLKKEATLHPAGRQGREGRQVQDRGPGVRRHRRADQAAGREERRHQRQAARRRALAAAHADPRLRPDDPARRHLRLDLARRTSAGGALGGFGRSTARRVSPDTQSRVTFEDVAGIDEAENELVEIVDFLKNPERYQRLGGAHPARRAALRAARHGQDAARARRGRRGGRRRSSRCRPRSSSRRSSASAPRACATCSSRPRRPRRRSSSSTSSTPSGARARAVGGISGGHDEREQTLNQILTEMDGFEAGTNVIVLGATNRPEILDPALLRPGRFDRRIAVQPPDRNGRVEILHIHTRSVPLADAVDLDAIAASTPGHDRRRPRAAGQRGGAVRRPPRPRARRAGRLHRRDREDHPRHRARGAS